LAAALDLFSRKGFEQTTMAEIAQKADFAIGTLYTLFKDKDALYRSLILAAAGEFEGALNAALAGPGTEVEKVEAYIETMAALMAKHVPLARIYFNQISQIPVAPLAGLGREVQTMHEHFIGRLKSVLSTGMRKGLFIKMDPELLALGLEGLSNAYLLESTNRPDELTADVVAGAVKRIFFEQVRLDAAGR